MKRHRASRWLLAFSVAACAGAVSAGPEECLTRRDNASVATCANRFARGTFPITASSPRNQGRSENQPIQATEQWLLFPVPTASAQPVARARPEPPVNNEPVNDDRDRSELILRSEIGAAGLAAMGLLFGVWKWRTSPVKRCSFCDARAAAGASLCKRCFRSI